MGNLRVQKTRYEARMDRYEALFSDPTQVEDIDWLYQVAAKHDVVVFPAHREKLNSLFYEYLELTVHIDWPSAFLRQRLATENECDFIRGELNRIRSKSGEYHKYFILGLSRTGEVLVGGDFPGNYTQEPFISSVKELITELSNL